MATLIGVNTGSSSVSPFSVTIPSGLDPEDRIVVAFFSIAGSISFGLDGWESSPTLSVVASDRDLTPPGVVNWWLAEKGFEGETSIEFTWVNAAFSGTNYAHVMRWTGVESFSDAGSVENSPSSTIFVPGASTTQTSHLLYGCVHDRASLTGSPGGSISSAGRTHVRDGGVGTGTSPGSTWSLSSVAGNKAFEIWMQPGPNPGPPEAAQEIPVWKISCCPTYETVTGETERPQVSNVDPLTVRQGETEAESVPTTDSLFCRRGEQAEPVDITGRDRRGNGTSSGRRS